jgi:hypothetical protein
MFPLIKYILKEHQVITSSRQTKLVDPRIILNNSYAEEDETLTLRLAINTGNYQIFMFLWDEFPFLYTERHLYILAKYLLELQLFDQLPSFLNSGTTHQLFLRSSNEYRQEFVDLFAQENVEQCKDNWIKIEICNTIAQYPYTHKDYELANNELSNIYELIINDEVDHLKVALFN